MLIAETQTANLTCYAIWSGGADEMPIPPDASYTFINITGEDVQIGDVYDPGTQTWSTP
jgi:hypothetical protein|tara:strand:+ start:689 stop:865 length:177 start_codon:yes stop_codon:yes gene_type:complete